MKAYSYLPRYAVPTAPLYHFIVWDIIKFAILLGCVLFGIYTEHRIAAHQIADLKAVIAMQRDELAGKHTADELARQARKQETRTTR